MESELDHVRLCFDLHRLEMARIQIHYYYYLRAAAFANTDMIHQLPRQRLLSLSMDV